VGIKRNQPGTLACLFLDEELSFFDSVHSPAGTLDVDDDGMMDHAVHDSGGNDGITEIIAQGLKINVCCQKGGRFAVALVDDLEEQRCVFLPIPAPGDRSPLRQSRGYRVGCRV